MTPYPTNLCMVDEFELHIDWSDGQVRRYAAKELRDHCPCATCREKRKGDAAPADPMQLNILSAAEAQPLRVAGMKPVGNYAYSVIFSDGHDTGIFTFEFLLTLGRAIPSQA